jgi:hypothetical protein
MTYTERWSESFELLAHIGPTTANGAVGEHNTGYVDVSEFHRVLVLVHPGEPSGAATIDVDVEEATSAAGAGAQNVTGVAPAQIVAADAGEPGLIEFQTEDMDAANDYRYINVEVIVAVGAYPYSVYVFGFEPRYRPVDVSLWREVEAT